jgi:L-cystine transport system substrate-binding protein
MKLNKNIIAVAVAVASVLVLSPAAAADGKNEKTKTVYAAHTQTNVPYDFVNEKGESDGYEIAVLKAIDELLPQYEFKFVPTSDEDLLIGIESGKYDVGTKGAWSTPERQKKFLFPKNAIGASVIGLAFRAENADKIKDIDSFAAFSGKLVPISPQSAQYAVVEDYNKKRADRQIKLVPSDVFIINDAYQWVLEGRYDAFFDLKLSFNKNVVDAKGPYHSLAAKLAYVPYKGIPTWPLFNKNDVELAAAFDKAFETLKANGTIAKISQKYFGEDVFSYAKD